MRDNFGDKPSFDRPENFTDISIPPLEKYLRFIKELQRLLSITRGCVLCDICLFPDGDTIRWIIQRING